MTIFFYFFFPEPFLQHKLIQLNLQYYLSPLEVLFYKCEILHKQK